MHKPKQNKQRGTHHKRAGEGPGARGDIKSARTSVARGSGDTLQLAIGIEGTCAARVCVCVCVCVQSGGWFSVHGWKSTIRQDFKVIDQDVGGNHQADYALLCRNSCASAYLPRLCWRKPRVQKQLTLTPSHTTVGIGTLLGDVRGGGIGDGGARVLASNAGATDDGHGRVGHADMGQPCLYSSVNG